MLFASCFLSGGGWTGKRGCKRGFCTRIYWRASLSEWKNCFPDFPGPRESNVLILDWGEKQLTRRKQSWTAASWRQQITRPRCQRHSAGQMRKKHLLHTNSKILDSHFNWDCTCKENHRLTFYPCCQLVNLSKLSNHMEYAFYIPPIAWSIQRLTISLQLTTVPPLWLCLIAAVDRNIPISPQVRSYHPLEQVT
jgi:hypothetical protein